MVAHVLEGPESYHQEPLLLTRDLAMVLVGFAGGFRRSEVARLRVEDLRFEWRDAVVVRLPWLKARYTDEPHERRICAAEHLELCPVSALLTWLAGAHITEGPVFRGFVKTREGYLLTDSALNGVAVDRAVRKLSAHLLEQVAGRRPRWSAHSLRAGLATAAALAGRPDREIADHLGHRSAVTTARYVRTARVTDPVGGVLGLDDSEGDPGLGVEDVVGSLLRAPSDELAPDDHLASGERDLLANLLLHIPAGLLDRRRDELRADIALGKAGLRHD